MTGSPRPSAHRLVVPDLPRPQDYLPLLEQVHENRVFTNFGPLSRRLEERLSGWLGAPQEACITCASATAGLSAALLVLARPGPVLVPAFTFPASTGAVRASGMVPVVADVDQTTWAFKGESLDRALAMSGAKTAMLVAPFGMRCDWSREFEICRSRGVSVVIDNASGLGATRSPGNYGEDVCEVFSMHATKPFAVGEGGAIFIHWSKEAAVRSALNFALPMPSQLGWGFNGKMSEFHAAVGLAQIERFPKVLDGRRAFAAMLRDRLAVHGDLVYPSDVDRAPWQFFPILMPSAAVAERFIVAAANVGVEIRRYYRPSLSKWPGIPVAAACPVAEDLAERMCTLPVRSTVDREAEEIADLAMRALQEAIGA